MWTGNNFFKSTFPIQTQNYLSLPSKEFQFLLWSHSKGLDDLPWLDDHEQMAQTPNIEFSNIPKSNGQNSSDKGKMPQTIKMTCGCPIGRGPSGFQSNQMSALIWCAIKHPSHDRPPHNFKLDEFPPNAKVNKKEVANGSVGSRQVFKY